MRLMTAALLAALAAPASALADEAKPAAPTAPQPAAPKAAPAKPAEAEIAKAKRLLDKAGDREKRRAKAAAAGKVEDVTKLQAERDDALAEVRAIELRARFDGLVRAVVSGSPPEARRLAAEELAALKQPASSGAIVKGFVREADRPTRIAESNLLLSLGAPDTAAWFAKGLDEEEPARRIRAMQGLALFRDRRSVPALIALVQQIAGGFGRAAVEFTTDRAYVSGWQLVSGGTGLQVVEVADPEVDVFREGVSMDVKVRTVEMRYAVGLLQDLTGQSIGPDAGAWRTWLAANPDFPLAPAKDRPVAPAGGAPPAPGSRAP